MSASTLVLCFRIFNCSIRIFRVNALKIVDNLVVISSDIEIVDHSDFVSLRCRQSTVPTWSVLRGCTQSCVQNLVQSQGHIHPFLIGLSLTRFVIGPIVA